MGTGGIRDHFRTLLQLEEDEGFFDHKVGDFYYWEWVREPVFRDILKRKGLIASPHNSDSGFSTREKVSFSVDAIENIFRRNPYLSAERDVLFLGHSRRKLLSDGYWWDIYVDPILNEFDEDHLVCELPSNLKHKSPPKTDELKYLDLPKFNSNLYRLLADRVTEVPQRLTAPIESSLEETFGVDVTIAPLVEKNRHQRRALLAQYRYLLSRIDPEIAVVVVSGYRKAFIEACKQHATPVVELQHGAGHKYNTSYEFPENANLHAFPDYLLVFGDHWRDTIRYPIDRDRVYSVGYPFHELMREKFVEVETDEQVVFASQGSIGTELSKYAVSLARGDLDHDIVYKLHPGEYDGWENQYPWLVDSNVRVVEDDIELYRLLATASDLVGVYSTVVYEAVNMRVNTHLVDLPGVSRTKTLADQGYASFAETPDELETNITRNESVTRTALFADHAVKNAIAAFEEIRARS
jgi:hypothetical protein